MSERVMVRAYDKDGRLLYMGPTHIAYIITKYAEGSSCGHRREIHVTPYGRATGVEFDIRVDGNASMAETNDTCGHQNFSR